MVLLFIDSCKMKNREANGDDVNEGQGVASLQTYGSTPATKRGTEGDSRCLKGMYQTQTLSSNPKVPSTIPQPGLMLGL